MLKFELFKISFKGRLNQKNFLNSVKQGLFVFALSSMILPIVLFLFSLSNLSNSTSFSFVNLVLAIILIVLMAAPFLYMIYFFVLLFSLFVRRLHDFGESGWKILLLYIPLLNILFFIFMFVPLFVEDGNAGANKYGPASA